LGSLPKEIIIMSIAPRTVTFHYADGDAVTDPDCTMLLTSAVMTELSREGVRYVTDAKGVVILRVHAPQCTAAHDPSRSSCSR
jgi:hypothetical protein